jgi:hypothetical protein
MGWGWGVVLCAGRRGSRDSPSPASVVSPHLGPRCVHEGLEEELEAALDLGPRLLLPDPLAQRDLEGLELEGLLVARPALRPGPARGRVLHLPAPTPLLPEAHAVALRCEGGGRNVEVEGMG